MPVFRDYNQSQGVFRSIRPNELLEPDHPARVIDKVVEMLDLREVYADYAEEGQSSLSPPDDVEGAVLRLLLWVDELP